MLSSLPPLPNTDVEEGLAAEPKALPDLEANPPNAEPLEVALASLAAVGGPNALRAEPELVCVAEDVLAANGEEDAEPKADVVPKAEVEPNAEVEPKPDDEPKAGADV